MKSKVIILILLIFSMACAKDEPVNPNNILISPHGYHVILEYKILEKGDNEGTLIKYDAVKVIPLENGAKHESVLTPDKLYSGVIQDLKNQTDWKLDTYFPISADEIKLYTMPYEDADCVSEVLKDNNVSACVQKNNGELSIVKISLYYNKNGISKIYQRTMELLPVINGENQKIKTCTYLYENENIVQSDCKDGWTNIGYGAGIELDIPKELN